MKARSFLPGSLLALTPLIWVCFTAMALEPPVLLRLEDPPDERSYRVQWNTEPGFTYELRQSSDLIEWNTVEGFPRQSAGTSDWHDFTPVGDRGFFRLRVSPMDPTPPEGMILLEGAGPFAMYMGKYEVTWSEWQTVRAWGEAHGYSWSGPDHNDSKPAGCAHDHPVHSVSWYDAVKWCNARSEMENLIPAYRIDGEIYRSGDFGSHGSQVVEWDPAADGYRLPTHMEWVFAAMGGLEPQYFIYSGSNDLNEVGWYWENSGNAACNMWEETGKGTHPVGQKLPNSLGLYDMSGNVNEWVWNLDQNARLFVGGSWFTSAESCRIDFVGGWSPDARIFNLGFRVMRRALPTGS